MITSLGAAATGLTRLYIKFCCLLDGPSIMSVVSALRSLKHLHVGADRVPSSVDQTSSTVNTFPGALLSVLVQLTHLYMGMEVTSSPLQHLSCLTSLQELQLPYSYRCSFQMADLAALQHTQQLTQFYR
jgi:hypothetical protein